MCDFYIPWICCKGYNFLECMSWIEGNAWEDKRFVSPKNFKKGKGK